MTPVSRGVTRCDFSSEGIKAAIIQSGAAVTDRLTALHSQLSLCRRVVPSCHRLLRDSAGLGFLLFPQRRGGGDVPAATSSYFLTDSAHQLHSERVSSADILGSGGTPRDGRKRQQAEESRADGPSRAALPVWSCSKTQTLCSAGRFQSSSSGLFRPHQEEGGASSSPGSWRQEVTTSLRADE